MYFAAMVWAMYQARPDHNAVFSDGGRRYAWETPVGGKVNGGLAIAGDMLYAESFAPAVLAVDRRSGRVRWRTPMRDLVMTTPIVAGGIVVAGTGRDQTAVDTPRRIVWGRPQGDEIVALDAETGKVRWRYPTVGEDMPSPALVRAAGHDAIAFANGDDRVRALDLHSGRLLWSTPVQGVSTMASAAERNGVLYVLAGMSASSHRPDRVYAVGASDGRLLWSAPFGNADVSPAVAGGAVVVESANGTPGPSLHNAFNVVQTLDAATGRLLWSYRSPLGFFTNVGTNEEAVAGTIDGDVLLQSLPAARRFASFDLHTGRLRWSIRTKAAVKMSAVATGGRVYFGDTSGTLYAVAERTGRTLSTQTFAKPFTCSSPVVIGTTLYVADWSSVLAMALPRPPLPRSTGPSMRAPRQRPERHRRKASGRS